MYQPVLIAVIVVVGYVPAVLPQTRCEYCTFQADEGISIIGEMLEKIPPYVVNLPLCDCIVENAYDLYRTPGNDVCEYLANDDIVLHHNITFRNLTIICDCKLPKSIMALTIGILDTLAFLNKEPCSSGNTAANKVNIQLTSLSLTEIRKLASCAKLANIRVGGTAGRIVAYWYGPQLALRHVEPPTGRQYLDKLKFSYDYRNFTSKCEGPPSFKIACKCLMHSDVIRRYILHAIQVAIQFAIQAASCYTKGDNTTEQDEFPERYLRCD